MATLTLSSTYASTARPLLSIPTPNSSYVVALAALQSPNYAALTTSSRDSSIHIFDGAQGGSARLRILPGQEKGTSAICNASDLAGGHDVLLGCSRNGVVAAWDTRISNTAPSLQMHASGRPQLLTVDAAQGGTLVAAGAALQGEDAVILYWDPRNPVAPLRRHSAAHSDDVTSVRFAPNYTPNGQSKLLSASTDGLLCISDATQEDEDEALEYTGNWGCSVARAGWLYGSGPPRVWARSDMETVSLWSSELDPLQNADRGRLAHAHAALPWVTDYIVECHSSRRNGGAMYVFVGSSDGDLALLTPREGDASWILEQTFTRGHNDVIRCALWDEELGLLLTGGEDAKLNIWAAPVQGDKEETTEMDSPSRKRFTGENDDNSPKRARSL